VAFPLHHPSASHTYVISDISPYYIKGSLLKKVGVLSNLVMSYLMLDLINYVLSNINYMSYLIICEKTVLYFFVAFIFNIEGTYSTVH
jgi:hypothetical protein